MGGADEGGLVDDPLTVGQGLLGVEDEQPVALDGSVEQGQEAGRRGEVPAHDDSRLGQLQGAETAEDLMLADDAHPLTIGRGVETDIRTAPGVRAASSVGTVAR
jgi:hypothetical protein